MPVPMPVPTPAPAPAPVKPPEPAPTYSGTVRVATFSDAIATEGDKKVGGLQVDVARLEAAVKRLPGVTSFAFDPITRQMSVGYSGVYSETKRIKVAIDSQGVSSEIVSPARVVVRPMAVLDDPSRFLSALKGVPGVLAAEREGNDLIAYADLSTASIHSIRQAVEGTGIRCQIASHEEIRVKFGAAGTPEALTADLERTKWVLRAEVDPAESVVKVLAVKGRVTRALIKSVMSKNGFAEAK